MKKLSKPQSDLLEKMRLGEGWQLAIKKGINGGRTCIQEGLRGHGGKSEAVNYKTACALIDAGMIVRDERSDWREDIYNATPKEQP